MLRVCARNGRFQGRTRVTLGFLLFILFLPVFPLGAQGLPPAVPAEEPPAAKPEKGSGDTLQTLKEKASKNLGDFQEGLGRWREKVGKDFSDGLKDIADGLPGFGTATRQLSEAWKELLPVIGSGSFDLSSLRRWEYRVIDLKGDSPEKTEETLNSLGNEGWECVNLTPVPGGVRYHFKRKPIQAFTLMYFLEKLLPTLVR